jgi:dolichyl-phosphate beta-glucosyltransferase
MSEQSTSLFTTSMDVAPAPIIVVPCFNEEHRIDERAFLDLVGTGEVRLLFVNDGSTDGTRPLLERLRRQSGRIGVLDLPRNMGKAEAVRRGLQRAIESEAEIVGYFDADLSTPGSELIRMISLLRERKDLVAVFGSRVARLGSRIRRSPVRHYSGRVFATFASLALGVAFYDTQCGAKLFRVNENLVAAVRIPFRSPWSFDVLLCQRLFEGTHEIPGIPTSLFFEMPLEEWTDVSGSKVNLSGSALALWDVLVVGMARLAYRRTRNNGSATSRSRVKPSGCGSK